MSLIGFLPPPGINSDDTAFAAEGRWADGANVRFRGGKPQVIKGYTVTPLTALTGICRAAISWTNAAANTVYVAFGTTTRLFVTVSPGTVLSNITPSGYTGGTDFTWTLANFGSNLLASPTNGTIYQWTGNVAVAAAEVTQAPDNILGGIITTPQRQVLALGCNEEVSGSFNGLCIRGCDIEDVTDWTSLSTNNAFEHILDGDGIIVGGRVISRNQIAIWTTSALWVGEYVGDPAQPYVFTIVGRGCGLAGKHAVTILNGVAYWIGTDFNFWTWAPGIVPQHIPCPILKDFQDNVNRSTTTSGAEYCRLHVGTISEKGEVWFFYPRSANTECSHYLAYCVTESGQAPVWFRGDIARTAWLDNSLVTSLTVSGGSAVRTTSLIGIDSSGNSYYHEYGNTANGSALSWSIQSADQYLDESDREFEIQRIIPDFEDQVGDVSLTVYVRDRPQRSATTKGPYTLTTSATKKDFRASGKIAAIKFSGGAASGSYVRIGKPLFEMKQKGARP